MNCDWLRLGICRIEWFFCLFVCLLPALEIKKSNLSRNTEKLTEKE